MTELQYAKLSLILAVALFAMSSGVIGILAAVYAMYLVVRIVGMETS